MGAFDFLFSDVSIGWCAAFAAAMLVVWWFTHAVAQRRVDALYTQIKTLDQESRAKVFAQMPPRLKRDIERRILDEKKA